MGTYFIVRCYVKVPKSRKWKEYEYGPYTELDHAIEMMIDHLKPISLIREGGGRLRFKAQIEEVIVSSFGQWEKIRVRIEEKERLTDAPA